MSGDMIGAAITLSAGVAMLISVFGAVGMYEKDGPFATLFRNIRDGLVAGWCLIRNALWSLAHRRQPTKRKPYLSADTVEELEIECYIGPYAEPFRAESLKAREAAKRKRDSVRVIEPCERTRGEHIFAMNGRYALCGTTTTPEYTAVNLDSTRASQVVREVDPKWAPLLAAHAQGLLSDHWLLERLEGDTLADCLGDPNRDHHWWRTFRDLEGFHTKCLRCGIRQERTKVFG